MPCKLSNGKVADKDNPPMYDTRLLREWLFHYEKVVVPHPCSMDRIVTDCACLGTGFKGRYPHNEAACHRHIPKVPYEIVDWKGKNSREKNHAT